MKIETWQTLAVIPRCGPDFAKSVFSIWFGDNPVDEDFRLEMIMGSEYAAQHNSSSFPKFFTKGLSKLVEGTARDVLPWSNVMAEDTKGPFID